MVAGRAQQVLCFGADGRLCLALMADVIRAVLVRCPPECSCLYFILAVFVWVWQRSCSLGLFLSDCEWR